jgi:uncharacterized protein
LIADLNAGEVRHTSPMDPDRVILLDSLSAYHRIALFDGQAAAFLLAMKDHVPYQNDNYSWFSSRYEKFLYIDRIVVAKPFQKRGIGTLLYRDLFDYARREKIPLITCEINIVPPNQRSLAFHARHGFRETGIRLATDGRKQVSMQIAEL